jgi:hypothetical protein
VSRSAEGKTEVIPEKEGFTTRDVLNQRGLN